MWHKPTFVGLEPSSPRASKAARGASPKQDTGPELLLRRALWKLGLRYRKNPADLPGVPDIAFPGKRVAVFVDGDFWHGKDWPLRKVRLARGHNAEYWIAKIESNIARDRRQVAELRASGWAVLRVWESDIAAHPELVVRRVECLLRGRG